MKPLFLALIATAAFSTAALTQIAAHCPREKPRWLVSRAPRRLARCGGRRTNGLSGGRTGGRPGFVQACMRGDESHGSAAIASQVAKTFAGRLVELWAEGEAEMMMRALLLAMICSSATAFAQSSPPKASKKPALAQAAPKAPMGCKLVGTVKGPSFGPGPADAAELRGAPADETTFAGTRAQSHPVKNSKLAETPLSRG